MSNYNGSRLGRSMAGLQVMLVLLTQDWVLLIQGAIFDRIGDFQLFEKLLRRKSMRKICSCAALEKRTWQLKNSVLE